MEPEARNPYLDVEQIDDPVPGSSFGSIGRFIEVRWPEHAKMLARVRLEIPYADNDLGWVDPETLRLFAIDPESSEFTLIHHSGVNTEERIVFANISKPGTYGVIGLPGHPALLEAIRLLSLDESIRSADPGLHDEIRNSICERILCGPLRKSKELTTLRPPGRISGDICKFCLSLHIPKGGLPDWQLIPQHPSCKPFPQPPNLQLVMYALMAETSGWDGPGESGIEIIDTSRWKQISTWALPRGIPTSLAISPDQTWVYVLDKPTRQIGVFDMIGRPVAFIPLSVLEVFDCVISRNGARLYVTSSEGLLVVDVATRTVQTVLTGTDSLYGIAVAPDDALVAAAGGGPGPQGVNFNHAATLYLFDVATLASKRIPITDPTVAGRKQVYPLDAAFTDNGKVVLWDSNTDSFYVVDVATAAQNDAATVRLRDDSGGYANINNMVSYSPASHRAYALKESYEVAIADIAAASGSAAAPQGGFSGVPYVPILTPDGSELLVTVIHAEGTPNTLDQYDTRGRSFIADVYKFASPTMSVRDARIL